MGTGQGRSRGGGITEAWGKELSIVRFPKKEIEAFVFDLLLLFPIFFSPFSS